MKKPMKFSFVLEFENGCGAQSQETTNDVHAWVEDIQKDHPNWKTLNLVFYKEGK